MENDLAVIEKNYALMRQIEFRSLWPKYMLKYEEDVYFHHRSDAPQELVEILFRDYRFCPMCGEELFGPWLQHRCTEPV